MMDYSSPTDTEANERYMRYRSMDPFPEIAPALLNSADIIDYVSATGMINPFYPLELKPASYGVALEGKCVYWNGSGEKIVKLISKGDAFILEKDSIAFLTLEPYIRLPDYIAARFDLTITNVYRGLLVGTGPLVDPGYKGKLSIPLHNLTVNDYVLRGGEILVYLEFTKLSHNIRWQSQSDRPIRNGVYVPFPDRKNQRTDIEDYLYKADLHRPIRSTIPESIHTVSVRADEAAKQVKSLSSRLTIGGIVAAVTLIIALLTVFIQVSSIIQDGLNYITSSRAYFTDHFQEEDRKIQTLQQDINLIRQSMAVIVTPIVTPKSP